MELFRDYICLTHKLQHPLAGRTGLFRDDGIHWLAAWDYLETKACIGWLRQLTPRINTVEAEGDRLDRFQRTQRPAETPVVADFLAGMFCDVSAKPVSCWSAALASELNCPVSKPHVTVWTVQLATLT